MRLLSYLPQQRIIDLRWLLAVSFIPGLLDFVSIAIIGRLTGSLVGGRLGNLVPGIKVFGETNLNSLYGLLDCSFPLLDTVISSYFSACHAGANCECDVA